PMRIVTDRVRGGVYLTVGLALAGMFGAYLFLTYYFQVTHHYTPLQAGMAFLPITVGSQAASWLIARRLMPRLPVRVLIVAGAVVSAVALAMLAQLRPDSNYLAMIGPAEVLLGAGLSTMMVPAFSNATRGVAAHEAGVAAAVVNATQQAGASIGVALLNSIAVVHGFATATASGAGMMLLAAVVARVLINAPRPSHKTS
ncbi:MAG TPA: MFS transporter, partial [Candidatus Dormibacteraeota bacterium]|nr:MFS transporter [Candidatus Dormibacteraeota bacterium]